METRSAKRREKQSPTATATATATTDYISNLPDEVIHEILSHLPIKSIAQTSSLSRRWKNLWHSFPDLDFTTVDGTKNALFPKPSPAVLSKHGRRSRAHPAKDPSAPADQISAILDNRRADIRVLRFRASVGFTRLQGLIRQAVRRNVQELDLEVSTRDYFNFPRVLASSAALKTLRLKSCHPGFRLPPPEIMNGGFQSLTVLSLTRPVLHHHPSLVDLFTHPSFPMLKKLHLASCFGLNRLRVECRGIEELTLESCLQLHDLEICVKGLEILRVSSCFDPYGLWSPSRVKVEAPRLGFLVWSHNAITDECVLTGLDSLREVFVGAFRADAGNLGERKAESVRRFLKGISGCCSLTLESQCVEKWKNDLWQSRSSGEERYWESQAQYMKPFLGSVTAVRIHGLTECANAVSLVKFLLKHGRVLQEVRLCAGVSNPNSKSRDSLLREKMKSQIAGFSRASSNATIVFQ